MESEPTPSPTKKNPALTTPVAVVIAGALIAIALYARGGSTPSTTAPTTNTQTGTTATQATPPPQTIGDFRPVDDTDHVRGATNAKVTIVEYSDLECPFCKQFHTTLQQILAAYPNDVRWVYRHAPLEQLHSQAPAEANAAECAAEQGRFWEFADLVFTTTKGNDTLDLTTLPQLAKQAGVANAQQFKSCVDSNKYADKVQAQLADAQVAGLRGTPYSVAIGPDGQKVPISGAQPLASVKTVIDGLLK